MQKEICIGAAFTTNNWRQLLATASDLTEIKLRPATSAGDWWNSSTRRMTPHKHLQKYGTRHHLLCLLLLQRCAYLKWWRRNHHRSSSYDIQLSLISMVLLEMGSRRRRWGLLKEAYDVDVRAVLSERYERRAILSTRPIQQRTQIHSEAVMGTLPNHVRVTLQQVIQYSPPLSLCHLHSL